MQRILALITLRQFELWDSVTYEHKTCQVWFLSLIVDEFGYISRYNENMRSKWILQLVFIIVGLWFIIVLSRSFLEFFSSGDRIKQSQEEVQKLVSENAKLKEEKDFRETNFFVEKEAREKLGYGIEGESTVIFRQSPATSEAKLIIKEEKPNWLKWLDFLF